MDPAETVYVVINHFNPKRLQRLTFQTLHCLGAWLDNTGVNAHIIVSDGSGSIDEALAAVCALKSATYLPSNETLTFGAGYNAGIAYARKVGSSDSFVCLSANDILADTQTLQLLVSGYEARADIGCAIPHLSHADLVVQNDWIFKHYRLPGIMTLNVNLFRLDVLAAIGDVPEVLTGYFNDIVMAIRLREAGYKIALFYAGSIRHLQRGTINDTTMSRFLADKARFEQLYPSFKVSNKQLPFKYSHLVSGPVLNPLYKIMESPLTGWLNAH